LETSASKFGEVGRSIAWDMMAEASGAGTWEPTSRTQLKILSPKEWETCAPFKDSTSNLTNNTEEGARLSSTRVKSRTFGSETLRSRLGGVWSGKDCVKESNFPEDRAYTV
jgi:hypothetical protein